MLREDSPVLAKKGQSSREHWMQRDIGLVRRSGQYQGLEG